jgi:steroid delta-isomerase-like uncharacterized protein
MADTRPNAHILMQFLEEVWNQGQVDACDAYIAPEYTIRHDPGDPWDQKTLTLAQFKERVVVSRAPFPDQRFVVQELFEGDQKIAITWLWSATHQADIPGFAATGQTIKMSGATVYYFDAGRITGHWQITDRLGVFMQLKQGAATA